MLPDKWLSILNQFNQLYVGYSGGLDSTVLLHVLANSPSLNAKLIAVHVNHGISPHANSWQSHCEQWCHSLKINLVTHAVHLTGSANLEERARNARYGFFSSLINAKEGLVLGHHEDDQAETFLLQLFRGAGIDGLSSMPELSQFGRGKSARPFLSCSREQLQSYATKHQLIWIEDESNEDIKYSRNYLRHQLVPLLKAKWPKALSNIARSATHCQQAKNNLDYLATEDCNALNLTTNSLPIASIRQLSFDRIINVLRFWLKSNGIKLPSTLTFHRLLNELIFARKDAMPEVSWGTTVVRFYQNHLYLDQKNDNNLPPVIEWPDFPSALTLGTVGKIVAKKTQQGLLIPVDTKITVRFRQGGEKFLLHGQTKSLKKMFQEWQVPPWLREKIPLIYFDHHLAAVVGYAMSDLFYTHVSAEAWLFIQKS